MKKLLVLLMILFIFTGCGQRPKVIEDKKEEEVITDKKEEEVVEEEFSIGEVKDNIYFNEYYNLKMEFDDKWYIYTEEEIASLQSEVIENFSDESVKELFENNEAAIIFAAINTETSENIQFVVEGLPLSGIKIDNIINNSKEALKQSYEAQGINAKSIEITDVTFNGRTEKAIETELVMQGVQVYQTNLCILKNKYYATICFTGLSKEAIEKMLSNINVIK